MTWDLNAPRGGERWAPAEDEFLRTHYPTKKRREEIADALGRTLDAVAWRAKQLGIRRPLAEPATPKQVACRARLRMAKARNEKLARAVRENWGNGKNAIAREFGVSANTVAGVAWRIRVSWKTGPSGGSTVARDAASSKPTIVSTWYLRGNRAVAASRSEVANE